jgi:hypothetical protein
MCLVLCSADQKLCRPHCRKQEWVCKTRPLRDQILFILLILTPPRLIYRLFIWSVYGDERVQQKVQSICIGYAGLRDFLKCGCCGLFATWDSPPACQMKRERWTLPFNFLSWLGGAIFSRAKIRRVRLLCGLPYGFLLRVVGLRQQFCGFQCLRRKRDRELLLQWLLQLQLWQWLAETTCGDTLFLLLTELCRFRT